MTKLVFSFEFKLFVAIKSIKTLFVFGSLLLSSSCSQEPSISFTCEKDRVGNYFIKWEVTPKGNGDKVKIYMSRNDSDFRETPILTMNVDDYVARISVGDSIARHFFRLKVYDTFSGIISNRLIKTDSVQNFRDVGGYFTTKGKQVKWGKIYRSGELSELTQKDKRILNSLNIKTIIDFRDHEEVLQYPDNYQASRVVHIPMSIGNRAYVREKIIDGSFYRGDAILFTQDTYKILVEDFADEFAQFFDILCDENNYPILFHGYLGKDRVGLAGYYLLHALDVSNTHNEEDYLLSNPCIAEEQAMGEARFLPERMQEAATVVCKANISYLNYAKKCMINKSGSIEDYMTNELKLTNEKREKLRKVLLY